MKKREFIYTKQAHQTLQYAQMVSQCTDKKHISSLTLFWGVFAMVSGTDQAGLFWTLLGVTNYESLETYFDAHYGSVLSDQKPERYQMVGSLFTLIDAQSADVA